MKVPDVDSRMACGTSLMSYSPLPSSSVKPTVEPSMRVSLNFSEITIWPLYVGLSEDPEEIGMVLTVLPSRVTVIVCALASTVETWLRPTLKVTVFCWTPTTPSAPSTPSRDSFRVTVEPPCQ